MKRIKTLHQGAICPNLKFESWLMGKIVWEANRTLTDGGSRWWVELGLSFRGKIPEIKTFPKHLNLLLYFLMTLFSELILSYLLMEGAAAFEGTAQLCGRACDSMRGEITSLHVVTPS